MKTLHTKLLRELWQMRGQVISIALVVACSVAVFVSLYGTLRSVRGAGDAFYERYRFAHVFAELRRAPRSLEDRIRAIPGASEVDLRIVADVRVNARPGAEPSVARLISLPPGGEPRLDRLVLRRGRPLDPRRPEEVLVSEAFAEAHKLAPEDRVSAVINGRRAELRVAGVALSPEYVFTLRGGDLAPDDRRFGVFWMSEDALGRAIDMAGAFNSVALALAPGASERDVIGRLDRILAPFGAAGAYGRSEQLSHRNLTVKLDQLAVQAEVMPAVFLGVAAFLLNVVLGRLVATQRSVIATLKAFGYGKGAIAIHYLEFVAAIVLIGAAIGVAAGVGLGVSLVGLYARYYRFPALSFQLDPRVPAIAVGVSLAASIGGALTSVRRAAALAPAEAMRPEAPRTYRPVFFERALGRLLSIGGRMTLRQLGRRPLRAALGIAGISFAVAIMVMSNFFRDSIDRLVDVQFRALSREDAVVLFDRPVSRDAVGELERVPGVLRVEVLRMAPARLVAGVHARRVAIQGARPNGELHPLLDASLRPVALPGEGVVLTRELAEALSVRPGEEITVEVLEGTRPSRRVVVAGLLDEFIGVSAYMDLGALDRILGEQGSISVAYLAIDAPAIDAAVARIEAMPRVGSVALHRSLLRLFRDELNGRMIVISVMMAGFASVIAAAVVYNSARIALGERAHELGSMRVLGFTRAEVSSLLLSELGVQVAAAIPLGCVLGRLLAGALMRGLASEAYRFPVVIEPRTYVVAAIVVAVAAVASALVVRRKIDRLDLAEVLRTRE